MRTILRSIIRSTGLTLILVAPAAVIAQDNRDYNTSISEPFEAPGSSMNRESDGSFGVESIDPFTGGLKIVVTDLVVPSNGGLALAVTRNYQSFLRPNLGDPTRAYQKGRTVMGGLGWDLHYGRLWQGPNHISATALPAANNQTGCRPVSVWTQDTRFNPVLEMPDGSRRQFTLGPAGAPYAYISEDRWLLKCLPTAQSTGDGGAIVVSPDGVEYTFTFRNLVSNSPINNLATQWTSNSAFHVTRIQHPNGTYITINYVPKSSSYYASIQNVVHSEGGHITFFYQGQSATSSTSPILKSFTHEGRTWNFNYTQAVVPNDGRTYLTSVTRPDGRNTVYTYFTRSNNTGGKQAGDFSLKQVTAPLKGEVEYTYIGKLFPVRDNFAQTVESYVVRTKTVRRLGGADPKTWYYNYRPATTGSEEFDFTDVKGPFSCETYEHYSRPTAGNVWRHGLLRVKSIFQESSSPSGTGACGGTLFYRETMTWASDEVVPGTSNAIQGIFYAPLILDSQTLVPRVSVKVTRLDGTDYTTNYNNVDDYGNPRTIVETGQTPTASGGSTSISRTTDVTYFNDTTNWIIGRLKDETVRNAGTTYATPGGTGSITDYAIGRTYYSGSKVGLLDTETRAGVSTKYDYFTGSSNGGEVSSIVDANGLATPAAGDYTTSFSNYKRGTAKTVSRPASATITQTVTREIYDTGMIAWERDGESKQTSYQYNEVNLLDGVTTARTDDSNISITRVSSNTNETIIRGNFREVRQYDGFGSLTRTDWTDTSTGVNVFQKFDYDAAGRVVKRYFPNSASAGITVGYDALDRVISELYTDGTQVTYDYQSNGRVVINDERGFITRRFHRAFGDPTKPELILVRAPRGTSTTDGLVQQTHIQRDLIGNVTSISQGAMNASGTIDSAVTRTYRYNTKFFVFEEINPETGTTRFARDNVGNITSKTVDATGSPRTTVYTLDQIYRLDYVTFPGTTGIVDYDYYRNDLPKQVVRGNATWDYTYDANNNLDTETLTLGAPAFSPPRQYVYDYDYNDKDALRYITYPAQSGLKLDYAPDALGRPTRVDAYQPGSSAAPFATSVSFHPNGQLNTVTLGNGVTTTFTQDSRLRPLGFTAMATLNGSATYLVNRVYGYDSANNVTSIDDQTAANRDKSMSYDGLNRLRTSNGPWGSGGITYHANDNIDTMSFSGSGSVPAYSVTLGYDSTNRLTGVTGTIQRTGYTYDAYGNVTNNGEFGAGKFTFDDDSLLRAVRNNYNDALQLEYVYDGNRRVVREFDATTQSNRYKATTRGGQTLFEEDIENSYTKDHVYVSGNLISTRMRCTSATDSDGDGISDCVEAKLGLSRTTNDAGFDADSDGLSNLVEVQNGTDIYKVDTDGDGLSDYYEVTNGLNGYIADSNSDTDGDGLSNLVEWQRGTKPNNPDTDNDGIPDGIDPAPLFNPAVIVPILELLLGS